MSDSPLVSVTRISPNRNSPRDHEIDTISIHCYVGQFTASQMVSMGGFTRYDPQRGASCNYCVGKDGSIGLCVPESDRSWCTSSRSNDNRAITIEVASDTTHPFAVTEAAYEALIDLLADICKRNHIPELRWKADRNLIGHPDQQNMTVHRWFAPKACPGEYLYSRHGDIARRVNDKLEDDHMTPEKFDALMKEWLNNQGKKDPTWEGADMQKAKDSGLMDGTRPKSFVTRGELAAVMNRLREGD